MFATEELISALNQQIGNEMQASLQYTSIACFLQRDTLPQMANVFYLQADEERDHAMRFAKFVVDLGGSVRIPALPASISDFESIEACVQLSVEGETTVTHQINDLVALASSQSNHVAVGPPGPTTRHEARQGGSHLLRPGGSLRQWRSEQ